MFNVEGMTCNHCKMRVEKALQAVDGVESVSVDVESKEVVVTGEVDRKQLVMAVQMAGYSVEDKVEPFNFKN